MDKLHQKIFSAANIGNLKLRNRIIRTACFEGMCPGGRPSESLIEHHRTSAQGGVALTTVAYGSVSNGGRTYETQLWMRPEIGPDLKRLTDGVHGEGAKASIQLGHCGYFANPKVVGGKVLGASRKFNLYGLSFCEPMSADQIAHVIEDFAAAAELAVQAGFDAVELHFGHGYLVSQFMSPYTNRRRDEWGGSLDNRLRLAVAVLRAVKAAVAVPVLLKVNLQDGFSKGLTLKESIVAAQRFEAEGADALVLSGGFVSKSSLYMMRGNVPTWEMAKGQDGIGRKLGLLAFGKLIVKKYPFEELFFLKDAVQMRRSVSLPLVLLGGVLSLAGIKTAMEKGFDFVAMGRALIKDPFLPQKMSQLTTVASDCDSCNKCIAHMDAGGVKCACN